MEIKIIKHALSARENGYYWSIDDQTTLIHLIQQLSELASDLVKPVHHEWKPQRPCKKCGDVHPKEKVC